jgi:PQQ enzyme-like repeat protein
MLAGELVVYHVAGGRLVKVDAGTGEVVWDSRLEPRGGALEFSERRWPACAVIKWTLLRAFATAARARARYKPEIERHTDFRSFWGWLPTDLPAARDLPGPHAPPPCGRLHHAGSTARAAA